jgi:hypothetical protein
VGVYKREATAYNIFLKFHLRTNEDFLKCFHNRGSYIEPEDYQLILNFVEELNEVKEARIGKLKTLEKKA